MNNVVFSSLKKVIVIIGLSISLTLVGHWVAGYGYVLKGICYAYLRGQSGPGIDESHLFYNNVIRTQNPEKWKESIALSRNKLSIEAKDKLASIHTTSYLIVKNNELILEKYWEGFTKNDPTNTFSAAKSIVSLLIGIAIDDGYIKSVEQPVADFLPAFRRQNKSNIKIKDLLTMSSGLSWSESGGNPYSDNARAYYGEDLAGQVNNLTCIEKPGVIFKYKSGNTQILGFIVEKATGLTLSKYFEKKIWRKIHAEKNALWNLDKKNGDEKAFCCLYLTPRDYAKIGQLILNNGSWNGQKIISEKYLKNALRPANYLVEKNGGENLKYGWHWWTATYKNNEIYYAREINGQYINVWPNKNAVIIRTGKKRKKVANDGHPEDFWSYLKIAEEFIE